MYMVNHPPVTYAQDATCLSHARVEPCPKKNKTTHREADAMNAKSYSLNRIHKQLNSCCGTEEICNESVLDVGSKHNSHHSRPRAQLYGHASLLFYTCNQARERSVSDSMGTSGTTIFMAPSPRSLATAKRARTELSTAFVSFTSRSAAYKRCDMKHKHATQLSNHATHLHFLVHLEIGGLTRIRHEAQIVPHTANQQLRTGTAPSVQSFLALFFFKGQSLAK